MKLLNITRNLLILTYILRIKKPNFSILIKYNRMFEIKIPLIAYILIQSSIIINKDINIQSICFFTDIF